MLQDLRVALRSFRRQPVFAAASILTLALAIGATTAVFSVVNAALLQPPPYPEPERILALSLPDGGSQDGQTFHYVRERARSFESIAAHSTGAGWNLVAGTHVEYVRGLPVSENFFSVLGIRPLAGREFVEDEDRPGGTRAVILSDTVWRRALGGRHDAIGETILLGGVPHVVVGVMPPSTRTIPAADVWTPLQVSPRDNSWNYMVLGRLKEGTSRGQAAAELDTLRAGLHSELRGISEGRSASLTWMSYQARLGIDSRAPLLLVGSAVAFLLLIACANVAALQLVRALGRRREMATRAALGGGRGRLVRAALTESIALAVAGGLAGLLVARWVLSSLTALVPQNLLMGEPPSLDGRVLAVTLFVSVGAGALFGIAPALAVRRMDLRSALWEGARGSAGRGTVWLRRAFTVFQVALATVLLVAAGLMLRTFAMLHATDPGFDPSNVIVGTMSLQGSSRQAGAGMNAFLDRAISRLEAIPGVEKVAVTNNVPIERALNLALEPPAGALVTEPRAVDWQYVTPGYLEVFRIPLAAGRGIEERDGAGSEPVALVNEAFARAYFGGAEVIGRQIGLLGDTGDPPRRIVGIVSDVKGLSGSGWTRGVSALGTAVAPAIYVPASQVPDSLFDMVHHYRPLSWAIRASALSPQVVAAVRDVVRAEEPRLPFIEFRTMEDLLASDIEMERLLVTLLGIFATIAVVLASVGLYGLMSYTVSQRRGEIAVRMALGRTAGRTAMALMGEGAALAVTGVAIGLVGAAVTTRLLEMFVYGVTPLDPLTYASGAALLVLLAMLSSLVPAARAARTAPTAALRLE